MTVSRHALLGLTLALALHTQIPGSAEAGFAPLEAASAQSAELAAPLSIDPLFSKDMPARESGPESPGDPVEPFCGRVMQYPVCPLFAPVTECVPGSAPESREEGGHVKDLGLLLLGALIGSLTSFYATIVFERYKRFRETLMNISMARQLNPGYPAMLQYLNETYQDAINFHETLQRQRWILDADGHHDAAKQVGRLQSLARWSEICIGNLLQGKTLGMSNNDYLAAVQRAYKTMMDKEAFTRFESTLKPAWKALLWPTPRPYLPNRMDEPGITNYFKDLM